MKFVFLVVAGLLVSFGSRAQQLSGSFGALANQQIKLVGFEGFGIVAIDSAKANDKGVFDMSYSKKDYGMGYLVAEDNKPLFVVLSGDDIVLKGESFDNKAALVIVKGKENKLFEQYASDFPRREQVLSAWNYLEKIYTLDALFAVQQVPRQAILHETQRLKAQDSLFLRSLDPQLYVSWYLPLRKLVSSVSTIAQFRSAEIPATIAAFRNINHTDPRLHRSGLLRDIVESHFWLIENSGRSLDSVNIEMKISIDQMIENLLVDREKLNETGEYLFKLLEKRSFFEVSEYLALKLLNEKSCTINNDFAAMLESYRAMKKGNTAPDFEFKSDVLANGIEPTKLPKKLSDLNSPYTVVIFGASWCPQCPSELSQAASLYNKWKKHGVEIVFVSLDDNQQTFKSFAGVFPFLSICDYQKWESPIAKSYHVFATPVIFLLGNKQEILLRPNSMSQLDAWVDWYLVQSNK